MTQIKWQLIKYLKETEVIMSDLKIRVAIATHNKF